MFNVAIRNTNLNNTFMIAIVKNNMLNLELRKYGENDKTLLENH